MKEILPRILKYGNPLLFKESQVVEDISSPEVTKIIHQMMAIVNHYQAAGISAPQLGIPLSIAIYSVPKHSDNPKYALTPEYDPDGVPLTLMINPRLKLLGEEIIEAWEGCMSLPGMLGKVGRYKSVECEYFTSSGELIRRQAHGFHSRILQHECDHLKGILYPMKLTEISSFGYQDEIMATNEFLL